MGQQKIAQGSQIRVKIDLPQPEVACGSAKDRSPRSGRVVMTLYNKAASLGSKASRVKVE